LARILHVDDDEEWRQLIKSRLGDHHVDSAESLQEAISLLQAGPPYDVALVDLNLATNNDQQGGDLLDLMRIRYPSTFRVLVTGSPPAGSVRRNVFERYGVEEIIIKRDLDMPDLRRVVEEAIIERSGEPSPSSALDRSALRPQSPALGALNTAGDRPVERQGTLGRFVTAREPIAEPPLLGGSQEFPEPNQEELQGAVDVNAKAADYSIGEVIDDRFEIIDVLGQGGFSRVYRVRDVVEAEERALKLFDSAAGYAAVRREIGALRKIHHPNVVEVFWAGKTAAGDWYLITEFIEGDALNAYVNGRRHMRDREAVDVALDVLAALVAFHPDAARLKQLDAQRREGDLSEAEFREWLELKDKGLVHRDIKPQNVMLTANGAKLLDFNIASRVGDPVRTQSGTPPYRPPDADLTRWDVSTDLFAVGVLLYQLVCKGRHPYPHAMPMADQAVIDPRTVRPDLNPDLADFLIKACAPTNADRFATAAEMLAALRDIRAEL
jgi:CheY-like chemotaxis protein